MATTREQFFKVLKDISAKLDHIGGSSGRRTTVLDTSAIVAGLNVLEDTMEQVDASLVRIEDGKSLDDLNTQLALVNTNLGTVETAIDLSNTTLADIDTNTDGLEAIGIANGISTVAIETANLAFAAAMAITQLAISTAIGAFNTVMAASQLALNILSTASNVLLATINTSLNNIEADTATIASDTTSIDGKLTTIDVDTGAIASHLSAIRFNPTDSHTELTSTIDDANNTGTGIAITQFDSVYVLCGTIESTDGASVNVWIEMRDTSSGTWRRVTPLAAIIDTDGEVSMKDLGWEDFQNVQIQYPAEFRIRSNNTPSSTKQVEAIFQAAKTRD